MNSVEAKSMTIKDRDKNTDQLTIELEIIENNQEKIITFSIAIDVFLAIIIATSNSPQKWLQNLINAHKLLNKYLFMESIKGNPQQYILNASPVSEKGYEFRHLCCLADKYLVSLKEEMQN